MKSCTIYHSHVKLTRKMKSMAKQNEHNLTDRSEGIFKNKGRGNSNNSLGGQENYEKFLILTIVEHFPSPEVTELKR